MCKLSPSILAADFLQLGNQIKELEDCGIKYLHLDIMDGMFVPNISLGFPIIQALHKQSALLFDVHLMIEEPIRYLENCKECGADFVTVHAEGCKHLHRTIKRIKELGLKAGVALNPATPLCMLDYIIHEVDLVLIMSVNPGYGGQEFITSSIKKIKELSKWKKEEQLEFEIEVDGGVTPQNAYLLKEAGVTMFVAGTAIFKGNIRQNTKQFEKALLESKGSHTNEQ